MTAKSKSTPALWPGWGLGAEPAAEKSAARTRYELRRKSLLRMAVRNPQLAAGTPVAGMTAEEVDELLRGVSPRNHHAELRTAYNFLLEGLERGVRQLRWDIELPAPMHRLRPPVSRFPLGDFESLGILHEIKRRLIDAITDPDYYRQEDNSYASRHRIRRKKGHLPIDARSMHVGHILLSAILFGAALKKRVLYALLRELQGDGPEVSGDLLWFSLRIPTTGSEQVSAFPTDDNAQLRRYFVDPVTGMLALRFLEAYGPRAKEPVPKLEELMTHALGSLGIGVSPLPTLPALLRIATLDHRLRLPASLVEYATREFETRSLPPAAWARLRHGQRIATMAEPIEPVAIKSAGQPFDTSAEGRDQAKVIRDVRAVLRNLNKLRAKRRKGHRKLTELRQSGGLCPILYCLVFWVEHLAERHLNGERKLAQSTILTYFSRIAPRLVAHGLDFSVADGEVEDFEDLYNDVLAGAGTDANRRLITEQLQSFHRFMQARYGVPAVTFDLQGGQLARVDTNIVTQREYLLAQELISARPGTSPWLIEMQMITLMLGFRTGMRRSEIQHLRLRDIQVLTYEQGPRATQVREVEIVLRGHSKRALKTPAARRRLPLHILLTDDELNRFLAFWHRRCQQAAWPAKNHNALLFSPPGEWSLALDNTELFEPITMALCAASGDNNLRFHHLRHSFANRLLVSLWNARHPNVVTAKWLNIPQTEEPAVRQKSRLWWEDFIGIDADAPSRKALFALGLTMGHSAPTATLQSYFHMGDVLLGANLEHYAPEMDVDSQAILLGIHPPSWRVFRSRSGIVGGSLLPAYQWALRRAAKHFPERIPEVMTDAPPEPLPPPIAVKLTRHWPRMIEIYNAVALLATTKIDRTSLFDRAKILEAKTGFDARTVLKWHRESRKIARHLTAKKRSVHGVMHKGSKASVDRRSSIPGVIPGPPHLHTLMEEAERVYNAILTQQDGGDREALMRAGTELILFAGTFHKTRLHLRKASDVKLCCDFLEALGYDRGKLTVHVPKVPNSPRRSSWQHWACYLGLGPAQIKGPGVVDESLTTGLSPKKSNPPAAPRGASIDIRLPSKAPAAKPGPAIRALRYASFIARVMTAS